MAKQLRRCVFSWLLEDLYLSKEKAASGCVFLSRNTGRLCLQLRSSTSRFPMTWGFWGGKVENNETPISALHRELEEELGSVPEYQKIQPLHKYTSPDGFFEYYSYVIIVNEEFIPTLNSESSGYAWFNSAVDIFPLHPGAYLIFSSEKMKDKITTITETSK